MTEAAKRFSASSGEIRTLEFRPHTQRITANTATNQATAIKIGAAGRGNASLLARPQRPTAPLAALANVKIVMEKRIRCRRRGRSSHGVRESSTVSYVTTCDYAIERPTSKRLWSMRVLFVTRKY